MKTGFNNLLIKNNLKMSKGHVKNMVYEMIERQLLAGKCQFRLTPTEDSADGSCSIMKIVGIVGRTAVFLCQQAAKSQLGSTGAISEFRLSGRCFTWTSAYTRAFAPTCESDSRTWLSPKATGGNGFDGVINMARSLRPLARSHAPSRLRPILLGVRFPARSLTDRCPPKAAARFRRCRGLEP